MFTNVWIITNQTTTDWVSPILSSVNGTSTVWNLTPTVTINSNSKLTLTFSENLTTSTLTSSSWFLLKENWTSITNTWYITFNQTNGNIMYYCMWGYDGNGDCVSTFDSSKTYTVELATSVIDWNSKALSATTVSLTINVVDTTPPTWSSLTYNSETNNWIIINWVSWNNNATVSSNGTVNLSILATDNSSVVDYMCISNDSITNNSTCSTTWKSYATTYSSWAISATEWSKTVYIKFKDASWNISSVYTDTIVWDKTWPTSTSNPSQWTYNNWSIVTVTLNCTDALSTCSTIYYTTDWSAPTTSSSSVTPWNTVSITWTTETKTLKFFGKDSAWNTEWLTNSVDFVFWDSYVTIDSVTSNIVSSTGQTLTWSCNYASWADNVEININSWGYSSVTSDCTWNLWSSDVTLLANQSNTIIVRLRDLTSVSSQVSLINDSTVPSSPSISINWWDSYASSASVSLSLSASDANGIDEMCISSSWSLTNDSTCTSSSWQNYSNTWSFTLTAWDWTNTLYAKFKDTAWNISAVTSDSIILDTATPTVSSSVTSWTYSTWQTVTLTSAGNSIYYTTDSTTPTSTWTLYSSALSFWTTSAWTTTLKVLAVSPAWNNSAVWTYTLVFACASVSNWAAASYPTCTITCNTWYTLNWSTCQVNSSWWWGGGWWWGYTSTTTNTKPSTSTTTTTKPTINTDSTKNIVVSITDSKTKIDKEIKNETIKKLANSNLEKINFDNSEYFLSFDPELKAEYNKYVEANYKLATLLDEYAKTKDKSLKAEIISNAKIVKAATKLDKDRKDKYVDTKIVDEKEIYTPKNEKIQKAVGKVENKVLSKFNKLLDSKTITEEEYNKSLTSYNNFVLHLDVYVTYKSKEAKAKLITEAKVFIKTFSKKNVIKKVKENIKKEEEIKKEEPVVEEKKTYKNSYTFSQDLSIWSYNNDVKFIQEILKKEWYFNYWVTGYYWDVTGAQLGKFIKDKFGIKYSWVFNKELQDKVLNLEVK